jgi:hypothetical protein
MNVDGIIAAIIPIVTALEQLGVAYYIGGSVVSSIYGIPRATFESTSSLTCARNRFVRSSNN